MLSRHIAFCTWELHPINRGGCGVVVDALARRLAAAGHRITILSNMPPNELADWKRWAVGEGAPAENLRLENLDALTPPGGERSEWLGFARQYARALQALDTRDPIDLVELHDYTGVAFELLRHRRQEGWLSRARIAVRVHGSLELIDAHEAPSDWGADRGAMHLMERLSLHGADWVLAPSQAMAAHYVESYGLEPAHVRVCPPPMDLLLPDWEPASPKPGATDLLVFGKLQDIKGVHEVTEAAVSLFDAEPGLPGRLVFAGADVPCPRHGRRTSACVRALVPSNLKDRFELLGEVPRRELPQLAGRARAGVIASKFESFCLAAHELRRLGLPLVVPDAPAFRDYFDRGSAIVFDGSTSSLAQALRRAFTDDATLARLRAAPLLTYPDVAPAYAAALSDEVPAHAPDRFFELGEREVDALFRVHDAAPPPPLMKRAVEAYRSAAETPAGRTARRFAKRLLRR